MIGIYSSLKSQKITNTLKEFQGKNFSNFKEKLSEVVIESISTISKEVSKLKSYKGYVTVKVFIGLDGNPGNYQIDSHPYSDEYSEDIEYGKVYMSNSPSGTSLPSSASIVPPAPEICFLFK